MRTCVSVSWLYLFSNVSTISVMQSRRLVSIRSFRKSVTS